MPTKITLKVIQGKLAQKEFTFSRYTTCILGRSEECGIQFPKEELKISRRHCRLYINPPDIRIRDLGSKTGTYVNDHNIGQRDKHDSALDGAKLDFPEHNLKDGDEIKLAKTVFRVEIEQNDPFLQILKRLLGSAARGEKALSAIQEYIVSKELGRGGRGSVYLARHKKKGEQLALKVVQPEYANDKLATENFLREMEIIKALHHHNIVQLLNYGCSNGTFFFTLAYCELGSVEHLMERSGGTLSVEVACHIIRQALDGLEYAHRAETPEVKFKNGTIGKERCLVHRDIKPKNILLSGVDSSPIAKLADFGIAKAFDTAGLSGFSKTGIITGSASFMPRQLVLDSKSAKPEYDVWAMAACLYYMLTGVPPRNITPGTDVWQTILETEPVHIRERNSSIPEKLAEVIDEALVDNPEIKIKSAAELKLALESVLK